MVRSLTFCRVFHTVCSSFVSSPINMMWYQLCFFLKSTLLHCGVWVYVSVCVCVSACVFCMYSLCVYVSRCVVVTVHVHVYHVCLTKQTFVMVLKLLAAFLWFSHSCTVLKNAWSSSFSYWMYQRRDKKKYLQIILSIFFDLDEVPVRWGFFCLRQSHEWIV